MLITKTETHNLRTDKAPIAFDDDKIITGSCLWPVNIENIKVKTVEPNRVINYDKLPEDVLHIEFGHPGRKCYGIKIKYKKLTWWAFLNIFRGPIKIR